MSQKIREGPSILFVDLQFDFTRPGGTCHAPRSSPGFVRDILFPFLYRSGLDCAEIVSDYRQPRPGDRRDCCRPGEWGYRSEVPRDLLAGPSWIKSMNSPVWTRQGIGDPNVDPGVPFQDPEAFDRWLEMSIGGPRTVILSGLTLDACVLCTAQELSFRCYDVRILEEGTDTRSGDVGERYRLLRSPPVIFWARRITFEELQKSQEVRPE